MVATVPGGDGRRWEHRSARGRLIPVWALLFGLMAPMRAASNQPDIVPVLRHAAPLDYPAELKAQRIIGSAQILCRIDENGDVDQISVEYASREEFGRAAAASVARRKYRSAMKDGRPFAVRVRIPVEFGLGPDDLAALEETRAKETLPPGPPLFPMADVGELPELEHEVRPGTPRILHQTGQLGQVVVGLVVDENGQPRDVHPVIVTHPECGAEAVAAVRKWHFVPGKKDGQVIRVAMEVSLVFFPEYTWASGLRVKPGVSRNFSAPGADVRGRFSEPPQQIKGPARDFDYPEEMRFRGTSGLVKVEFIVNPQGAVTYVHALDESTPFFSALAERTVSYWKFKPARWHGVPVACRVVQSVDFRLEFDH